jgi:aspartyl-tRNA synthetase
MDRAFILTILWNHRPEIMFKAFKIAGYGKDEVENRFGGMVNAFQYGAPPTLAVRPVWIAS